MVEKGKPQAGGSATELRVGLTVKLFSLGAGAQSEKRI